MKRIFCGTRELDLSTPKVMGILNLTTDSFYDGGRFPGTGDQLKQVEKMLSDGASIVDIGAVSTRPGAGEVEEEEEIQRITRSIKTIIGKFPGIIVSVDTFRPNVARIAIDLGAGMINDVYGGRYAKGMFETVAKHNIPYVLMHMKGTPRTMQDNPHYSDVLAEVTYFFENQLNECHSAGLRQVIIDPGFGFGKTVKQNFTLLAHLENFTSLEVPVLVGISRKSMISKPLNSVADLALNGTTVLNTIALTKGASILRVHDVKEAVEAIRLVKMLDQKEIGNFA